MKINENIFCAFLYILCIIILYILWGSIIIHPNAYQLDFAGDGGQIYHDILYYVNNDSGFSLSSMNYPYREYIFMTDMQAGVAIVCKLISKLIGTSSYTIGIVNFILFYSFPFSVIYCYKIFRKFKIDYWFAAIAAIFICFNCPQVNRMNMHLGLGYCFYIPFILYCIWQLLDTGKSKYFIGLFLVILFFGFNNMYILLIGLCLTLLSGLLYMYCYRKNKIFFNNGFKVILSGLIPFIIIFCIIKFLDDVPDRTKVNWGFFYYNSSFRYLLFPQYGYMKDWFIHLFKFEDSIWEGLCYVGVLGIPMLLYYIISFIYSIFKWKKIKPPFIHRVWNILLVTSFIMWLVSMSIPFNYFPEITEKYLAQLMLFRGIARLSWPMYFVFSIFIVYHYYQIVEYAQRKKNTFFYVTLIAFFIIAYTYTVSTYLHYVKLNSQYTEENYYIEPALSKHSEFEIEENKYQAILNIPALSQWSGKVGADGSSVAWRYAMLFSYKYSLPNIHSRLSRMSVSQALQALQTSSSPLIHKTIFDILPNKKPILIICDSKNIQLNAGEKNLLKKATWLYTNHDSITFYALDVNQPFNDSIELAKQYISNTNSKTSPYIYQSFEDANSSLSFEGKKSFFYKEGNGSKNIFSTSHAKFKAGDTLECSFWAYCDYANYRNSQFTWDIKNKKDSLLFSATSKLNIDVDNYKHWIRRSIQYTINDTSDIFSLSVIDGEANIDALMIKEKNSNVYFGMDSISKKVNFNNYIIE